MRKMPLLVHLVFHQDSNDAREVAIEIHEAINHDAIVPGLDIPTCFCDCHQDSPPQDQGLDRAEKSFVVVMADNYLLKGKNSNAWQKFIGEVWNETDPDNHRFVPIQLAKNAWGFSEDLKQANISFGRTFNLRNTERRNEVVKRAVLTELFRFLKGNEMGVGQTAAPVKFFISHAKTDLNAESQVVNELLDTLTADQPIESWVDSGDIPIGSDFAKKIEDGIKESSVMVVLTDNYATREWCRTEVILAKEHDRPIVVVNALEAHEIRSFPYIGNVPVIRWNKGSPYGPIDLLLKETVRQHHTRLYLEQRREVDDAIFVRAPELATIAGVSETKKTMLYPDPPLGREEVRLISCLGVTTATPLERIAKQKALENMNVAVSMSASSDIESYGFCDAHLNNTIIELSRYLLIQGAMLCYGGNLEESSMTELLFDLVHSHNQIDRTDNVKPILNYVGWPNPVPDVNKQGDFFGVGDFDPVGRPDKVDENLHTDFVEHPSKFEASASPEHRFAWCRGLSKMRQYQSEQCKARIVLGGSTGTTTTLDSEGKVVEKKWYSGKMPGVLEEVFLSAKLGQPVFLLGALGGAAALVVDIIEGVDRKEATWDFQKQAPHSEEVVKLYEKHQVEWTGYPAIIKFLRETGVAGINPTLSEEENRELFTTIDLMRAIELVLQGLSKIEGDG